VGLLFFIGCGGKPVTQQKTQTVQVQITDQGIQMPPSLPAGATTFEVSNTGSSEHSFGIAGPAGDKKLEEPLKPGESASLDVFLDSGSYRVYSPVDQGVGMQIALNVLPEPVGRSSRKG
jgi:uncharacterized cupredoxin-like copper-binding protein